MRVTVNGKEMATGAQTLHALRDEVSPDADIIVRAGFVMAQDAPLREGDAVSLIVRGRVPPADEMEALMAARHTPGVHEKLKRARVAVAGLGGLGSHIAVALARIGVGVLRLFDFDVVEPSNLNRQYYFVRHIGMPKTEAMAELLRDISPYIAVKTQQVRLDADNIPELLAGCDVIVEAFDNPQCKAELVNCALETFPKVKIICASGMAGYDSANKIQTRRLGDRLYLCGDGESAAREGWGLMAPRVMVCAGHEATMVMRVILGENEA